MSSSGFLFPWTLGLSLGQRLGECCLAWMQGHSSHVHSGCTEQTAVWLMGFSILFFQS